MAQAVFPSIHIAGFHGAVLHPGSAAYDEARTLWNGMIDRHPALIVQPENTAAVSTAVRFAREVGLPVAVKGGGHSAPGHSIPDGALVIDLVRMADIRVDPERQEAWGQGGALLGDLDRATAPHGLVVPAGAISHTGMGGLVLGGGFGHIMRKFGLSIDSLLSAEVVLADGAIVTADENTNPDLFWALRGGSGNFGIVTEFHFACHIFGPDVFVAVSVIEPENARQALEIWRSHMEEAPDELAWLAFFRGAPSLPGFDFIPQRLRDQPVLLMPFIWAGDPEEGRAYIEPLLAKLDFAAAKVTETLPYVVIQQQWDEVFKHGLRPYGKAGFLGDLPDAAISVLLEALDTLPNPRCQVEVLRLGGAIARIPEEATAFPHRLAKWPVNIIGLWESPEEDEQGIAWVRKVYEELEPHMSGGTYVNYASGDESGGASAPYGGAWERLVELKEKYDPENVFRFNANLSPK